MSFLEREGYRIRWESEGSGTPLLLIMGAVYSSDMWYPALPALTAAHQVIRFDNQGIGQSTWARPASIDVMVDDALAVLDASGVGSAHVYGISLGGVIALELAARIPDRVRSLVLGCTCVLTRDKPRAPVELNDVLRVATREQLVAGTIYGTACPPERREANQRMLASDTALPDALVAQQDALRAYAGDPATAVGLTMPTLVLHGSEDPVVPVKWGRELADLLPDSRYVEWEGTGHNYLAERPDEANRAVLDFLADADRALAAT